MKNLLLLFVCFFTSAAGLFAQDILLENDEYIIHIDGSIKWKQAESSAALPTAECNAIDPCYVQPFIPCGIGIISSPIIVNGLTSTVFRAAENFILPGDKAINEIAWNGNAPSEFDNFEITYYDDNGDLPGSIIAGPFPVIPSCIQESNFNNNSFYNNFYSTHPPVDLQGGTTYWVSIFNNLDIDPNSPVQLWGWNRVSGGPLPPNLAGFAFSIDGDPFSARMDGVCPGGLSLELGINGALAPIPTLGQWSLILLYLLFGILGLLLLRSIRASRIVNNV